MSGSRKKGVSRRKFMKQAAVGTGAAAVMGRASGLFAQEGQEPGIRVPPEVTGRNAIPAPEITFPMSGADVFASVCREEGLAALFCCPGNYQVVNAIASQGIAAYGGRHEGAMASAADAFIRVTGEIAACSGTEGPGFTNMICAVAAACFVNYIRTLSSTRRRSGR